MEFVASERECCPFFGFEIDMQPNCGPIWLRLRGGEGVKRFVEEELGVPRGVDSVRDD